jgi:hypothetical protein
MTEPFGTRAFDAVVAAKRANPQLTRVEAAVLLHNLFEAQTEIMRSTIRDLESKLLAANREIEALKVTVKRPAARLPSGNRTRNPLFDELARSTGTIPLAATKPKLREIAVALADIKAVSPDLTPEEIQRRAKAYSQAHPPGSNSHWTLTAKALAKYWGDFAPAGAEPRTREAQLDIYREPPSGWEEVAVKLYGDGIRGRTWFDIRSTYGLEILRTMLP